jgi:hypothetical protein
MKWVPETTYAQNYYGIYTTKNYLHIVSYYHDINCMVPILNEIQMIDS